MDSSFFSGIYSWFEMSKSDDMQFKIAKHFCRAPEGGQNLLHMWGNVEGFVKVMAGNLGTKNWQLKVKNYKETWTRPASICPGGLIDEFNRSGQLKGNGKNI